MRTIDLAGDWQLIRAATREKVPARVPGDTHSALLAAGKIPDPYLGMNELEVQWVGREDWSYERSFEVDDAFLAEEAVFLSCDSLDTIADVFLNGKKVGSADNMFVRWRFDAKPFLRPGKNTIRVLFTSAEKAAVALAPAPALPRPAHQNPVQSPHRNLVRKVQCHAGWDWGPCLMVAGISGDISLGAFSDARIDYVMTEQKHRKGKCVVRVTAECEAARAGRYELEVTLGSETARARSRLPAGSNAPSLDIVVDEPRLWWPNGYGGSPSTISRCVWAAHSVTKRIGLRRPGAREPRGQAGALHDVPRQRRGHLLQGRELDPVRRAAPAGDPRTASSIFCPAPRRRT